MIECKNCKAHFKGKYCSNCGQKVYSDHDKSLKHIFEEVFHFFTHFEGTFFTTLKAVLFRPGQLSLDYSQGIRKKYYKPISFFFLIVIIYLLFPVFQGLNQDLKSMELNNVGGNYITRKVEEKLASEKMSEEALFEAYHHKSTSVSKFLLFLLIPFTALIIYLLHIRKKKYAFDYFILATEINIFFLLTNFVLMPLVIFLIASLIQLHSVEEPIIIIFSVVTMVTFLTVFFRRTFQDNLWVGLFKGLVFFAVFFYFTFVIYKLIVFHVTLWLC